MDSATTNIRPTRITLSADDTTPAFTTSAWDYFEKHLEQVFSFVSVKSQAAAGFVGPIISVGSGNGRNELTIRRWYDVKGTRAGPSGNITTDIVCIDPKPLSYYGNGREQQNQLHNHRIYINPSYASVDNFIAKHKSAVGQCILLLLRPSPNAPIAYDIEAIEKLRPCVIVALYDKTGADGSSDFHQWLHGINAPCDRNLASPSSKNGRTDFSKIPSYTHKVLTYTFQPFCKEPDRAHILDENILSPALGVFVRNDYEALNTANINTRTFAAALESLPAGEINPNVLPHFEQYKLHADSFCRLHPDPEAQNIMRRVLIESYTPSGIDRVKQQQLFSEASAEHSARTVDKNEIPDIGKLVQEMADVLGIPQKDLIELIRANGNDPTFLKKLMEKIYAKAMGQDVPE